MPWDKYFINLRPGDEADLDGPEKLVQVLLAAREDANKGMQSHLADEQLGTVVNAAYYPSLRPEEGRYPRFRLFAYHSAVSADSLRRTVSFDAPIPFGVEALRRLAAAFPPLSNALVVVEEAGEVTITGSISLDITSGGAQAGRPELWVSGGFPTGLHLIVDGPGEIRVSETFLAVKLRGGRLSDLVPLTLGGTVAWLDGLAESIVDKVAREHGHRLPAGTSRPPPAPCRRGSPCRRAS